MTSTSADLYPEAVGDARVRPPKQEMSLGRGGSPSPAWPLVIGFMSVITVWHESTYTRPHPEWSNRLSSVVRPIRSINGYGLFPHHDDRATGDHRRRQLRRDIVDGVRLSLEARGCGRAATLRATSHAQTRLADVVSPRSIPMAINTGSRPCSTVLLENQPRRARAPRWQPLFLDAPPRLHSIGAIPV